MACKCASVLKWINGGLSSVISNTTAHYWQPLLADQANRLPIPLWFPVWEYDVHRDEIEYPNGGFN